MCATEMKAAAQLSGDAEIQAFDEATVSPTVNPEEQEIVRKKILDSQYKCFEKMNRDSPYNKSGTAVVLTFPKAHSVFLCLSS